MKAWLVIRKVIIFIVGCIVLLAGVVMLITPGPGLLGIIAGLLILSTEFEWAKQYLENARRKLKETNDKIRNKGKDKDKNKNNKSNR